MKESPVERDSFIQHTFKSLCHLGANNLLKANQVIILQRISTMIRVNHKE